ncbi:5-carboxymethyl-2-hydroxymuconate Delta-isomerase [Alphaproteobacteria bacterium]|jgi:5-carboxymethyl-2-hydroxymuconate isomerase|nr:5-carboxymethyl-2-hydroxymuconate Delta-isomerase [Alphaproteobacteria bacterium]
MPHFKIEYSANLDMAIDMTDLCDVVREAALETGIFPVGGLRVRAVRCEHYSIADGNPDNAFIDIAGKVGVGREERVRKAAAIMMFQRVETFLEAHFEERPLALSFEIRELDENTNMKRNSIHEKLKEKGDV